MQSEILWGRLQDTANSQLVDKVVAEVLRDVFVPRLSHACSRRRSCRGHGAQVPHTIIHQTRGYDTQEGKSETSANTELILTWFKSVI